MIKIAPSILGADFARMGEQVKLAEAAGADWLHVDIMDGHFVPNLTMGPDMVAAVDGVTDLFQDVHLMVTNPENFFAPFAEAGADLLTFHIEVAPDPTEMIARVRDLGCRVGLSLNPDRPIDDVLPFLDRVDLVLIMSVYPGFGGQGFIEASFERVRRLREYIDRQKLDCLLEVDGGVNGTTGPKLVALGANVLVMGSAFFGAADPAALVRELRETHGG